jgi:thiamine biosynthesis lipoprotein ApbE
VAAEAATADALATAFLVGGPELARRYCEAHADVLAILTPEDGKGHPLVFGSYSGAIVED